MANDEYYGWISKSNAEGFIVAFPNGTSRFPSGILATWNAGACCGYARDNNVSDVLFVKKMIADIETNHSVNSDRVFATGMSNGGMFSYRLACDLSRDINAIASVAGTDNCNSCRPKDEGSVLHIHALNDNNVLFNGGAGSNALETVDFTSVPDTIALWVDRNGCDPTPQRVLEVTGAYCDEYTGCDDGTTVKLCVTEEGGHSWPGADAIPSAEGDTPTQAIDATDIIWDFFNAQ